MNMMRILKKVLDKLNKDEFKVNIKMQYKQENVKLRERIIDEKSLRPISDKVKKIQEFKQLTTKEELQSFLGFVNYYRNFINKQATTSAPKRQKDGMKKVKMHSKNQKTK